MEALPQEIVKYMVTYFDKETKTKARAVNKQFFGLINQTNFNFVVSDPKKLELISNHFSKKNHGFGMHVTYYRESESSSENNELDKFFAPLTQLTTLVSYSYEFGNTSTALTNLESLQAKSIKKNSLAHLSKLRYLKTEKHGKPDIGPPGCLPNLENATFGDLKKVLDVANPLKLTQLKSAMDKNGDDNVDLSKFSNLKVLGLGGLKSPPIHLPNLEKLKIGVPMPDIQCPKLTKLVMERFWHVDGIVNLSRLPEGLHSVKSLAVPYVSPDVVPYLETFPNLEEFIVGSWDEESSTANFLQFLNKEKLKSLAIACYSRKEDLDPLKEFTNLENLDMQVGCEDFDLELISGLTKLRTLNVAAECVGVANINIITRFTNMRTMSIETKSPENPVEVNCRFLTNLHSLSLLARNFKLINFSSLQMLRYLCLDMDQELLQPGNAEFAKLTDLASLSRYSGSF